MTDILKAVSIYCKQPDEFEDKYIPVKPWTQSRLFIYEEFTFFREEFTGLYFYEKSKTAKLKEAESRIIATGQEETEVRMC